MPLFTDLPAKRPDLCHTIATFEDTGMRKPSPEPFQKALDLLGVTPREALMVGDWAERDVVGAAQLGIRTVFASYGDRFGTQESGADFELADILDLLGIVDRLNQVEEPDRRAGAR